MSNKPGRRPMLVTFITKFACEEFLKMSHTPEFTKKFPNVSSCGTEARSGVRG
jgi:hypothetical protein